MHKNNSRNTVLSLAVGKALPNAVKICCYDIKKWLEVMKSHFHFI